MGDIWFPKGLFLTVRFSLVQEIVCSDNSFQFESLSDGLLCTHSGTYYSMSSNHSLFPTAHVNSDSLLPCYLYLTRHVGIIFLRDLFLPCFIAVVS